MLNALVPSEKWHDLSDDGHALIAQMQFGSQTLPADWVSLNQQPKPADGFPAEFGYNALRIPLYLMRGGIDDRPLLRRFQRGMAGTDGAVRLFDLATDSVKATLNDPGYRIINHILACVLAGTKFPESAKLFVPTLYFPSTLQLLGLAYVAEKHAECL